jgi:hypothetical protein
MSVPLTLYFSMRYLRFFILILMAQAGTAWSRSRGGETVSHHCDFHAANDILEPLGFTFLHCKSTSACDQFRQSTAFLRAWFPALVTLAPHPVRYPDINIIQYVGHRLQEVILSDRSRLILMRNCYSISKTSTG